MNCDGVFKVLTRGPFPTGSSTLDVAVEHHLACCASCRRLATALQPAIEVFEEAVSPDESRSLPSYSGHLAGRKYESLRPLTRTRRSTRTLPMSTRRRVRALPARMPWQPLGHFALAVMAGMVLAIVFRGLWEDDATAVTAAKPELLGAPILATRPFRADGGRIRSPLLVAAGLDNLNLSSACRPDLTRPTAFDVREAEGAVSLAPAPRKTALAGFSLADNCCARCHNPGAEATSDVSRSATLKVTQNCGLCHME